MAVLSPFTSGLDDDDEVTSLGTAVSPDRARSDRGVDGQPAGPSRGVGDGMEQRGTPDGSASVGSSETSASGPLRVIHRLKRFATSLHDSEAAPRT